MYSLSNKQIDYILDDIRARGIEMESLQGDLLDHICCIIEHNLEANGDFENFYNKTISSFYKKELREIEEETISLLTFKHYYQMKKLMIISGGFSVAAFIGGSFLKIMHWPGASMLLLLAILTASLIFLPLMFVLKVREVGSTRDKVVTGLGTFFGIISSLGTLFKIMHWPYANMMMFVGLVVFMFLFVPIYFFTGIRNPETKVNVIVSSVIYILAGGLIFSLIDLRNHEPEHAMKMYAYIQNEALLHKMQQNSKDSIAQNIEIQSINKTAEELKGMILENGTGEKNIPQDFEAKNLVMQEGQIGAFFVDIPRASQLLTDLQTQMKQYNATQNETNKIAMEHSILSLAPYELRNYTNYFVLNNISQLQFQLINVQKSLVATK